MRSHLKFILPLILFFSIIRAAYGQNSSSTKNLTFFDAKDSSIQYTGRIDFSNPSLPRFWSPGVYIKTAFAGTSCEILLNDEVLYGTSHNYISVIIDDLPPKRIKLSGKINRIKVAEGLSDKVHTILICKDTESGIGYLEFSGLFAEKLVPLAQKPLRKIEFIGNSITCGMGSDESVLPCNTGEWYDQHNAFRSYGPVAARALNAQWVLSSISGIGLIKSCCNMTITMPEVFDKINLRENTLNWNFSLYQPDVVTVCLGQNDGKQDSAKFCGAYVTFLKQLREYYPKATLICLSSPMADAELASVMKSYLSSVTESVNRTGDSNVYSYFFSRRFHKGCGDHPSLQEHQDIAKELSTFIKQVKNW